MLLVAVTSRQVLCPKADSPGSQEAAQYLNERRPAVFTFWNKKLVFFMYFLGKQSFWLMLTPKSKTDPLVKLAEWFGMRVAVGSLEGGGRHALVTLMDTLKNKGQVAISVDGQRGDSGHLKAAPLILAQESQHPVIPISWSSRWTITLRWKGREYELPLPFSKIQVTLSTPVHVTKHFKFDELETVKSNLKQTLERLSEKTA
jgi:lysophospholipid acyltransferase (LPLAT)-like uncharacterized protein